MTLTDGLTASDRSERNGQGYLYTYARHESEAELCSLELSCLFPGLQLDEEARAFRHARQIEPSRSPFIKQRLDIRLDCGSDDELMDVAAASLSSGSLTFRSRYVKTGVVDEPDNDKRLALERRLGLAVEGEPDLKRPDIVFGLTRFAGRWLTGILHEAEPVWLRHQEKPRQYSTALPTRAARAAVNIAVPEPEGQRLLDPCCGIGTVLLEALSMGVDIRGGDLNPLAATGARANLEHFGYSANLVSIADMRSLEGRFDAAILDMPYNLCSVSPPEEQLDMLQALRRLAARAVIVTTEPIEPIIREAGYRIQETARLTKGNFVRFVHLCVKES
ncbi:RsmD family RNA methyltransferase [Paenibacillus pasadenensis]|uniref:TRM11 family SAM-dependent methyltransferase n=1 Tax=Paenibacillus pasadenensis TaxID=217090 RepID=UPI00203F44FF|nr:RsmD family RNA methyltransferase [Paenibacillus pasadenensis]MCM3749445.1 RsmD family RNA methyltransferase [Paenibacillus pasadenensis]